ncbi:MAG: phosphatase PAP2 family protein [Patescibacteria group bacterium]
MNNTVFSFFYNLAHQSQILDSVIVFFAVYFPFVVVFGAGIFLFRFFSWNPQTPEFFKKYKEFLPLFFSSVLAYCLAYILKILFHISRPILALPDIQPLLTKTSFSFPSEHATFFMALAFSIFFLHKKAGYIFMFFAFLIGLARIVAGVHFPIDILGGFILGIVVAFVARDTSPTCVKI